MQSSLGSTELVQSVVVSSAYLEPQGVTLTELPGGTIQTLPGGGSFEGESLYTVIMYISLTTVQRGKGTKNMCLRGIGPSFDKLKVPYNPILNSLILLCSK